jgi:hypothetical protein
MPRLAQAMKDVTSLRNASGRRLVACDPEVSEWGNPICKDHPRLERRKLTQGSETSQYLEE